MPMRLRNLIQNRLNKFNPINFTIRRTEMSKRDALRLQNQIDELKAGAHSLRLAISNEAAARKGEPQTCECGLPKGPIGGTSNAWSHQHLFFKELQKRASPICTIDDIGPGVDLTKKQISCAAKGHRITLKRVQDEPDTILKCCFQCTECEVKYNKREDQLNTKERALFDAFNLKPEQNDQA